MNEFVKVTYVDLSKGYRYVKSLENERTILRFDYFDSEGYCETFVLDDDDPILDWLIDEQNA